jgi:peptidyl-dipeptidase A
MRILSFPFLMSVLTPALLLGAAACPGPKTPKPDAALQKRADAFVTAYSADLAKLEKTMALAYWAATNTGKKEEFEAYAKADLALKTLHSDAARYRELTALLARKDQLAPLTVRSLEVADLSFKGNQLPADVLEGLVKAQSEIEQIYNSFRGTVDGKAHSNNELLEKLKTEKDGAKRQAVWEALKQVGAAIGPKLVELAKLRNAAARKLGYRTYWEMQVKLQEHDPAQVLALFLELEKLTDAPFKAMKQKLDAERAAWLGVAAADLMPWSYDDPFFQAAPPSAKVNLDEFYSAKRKEDLVELARRFFSDIGIDAAPVIARSDLYERPGKQQHAYCMAVDRQGDVRMLLNIKPTAEWMDTMLHETGHGVYYALLDYSLPYNLRESAHIFTTEAVAMMFGALAKSPAWLLTYAGADPARVRSLQPEILEQRRREQLIFARWSMVMLHFEKALYDDPSQDLAKQWWDLVERFQGLKRPAGRTQADWASKPHFTIAPVYYHNYLMGELLAAQLRASLAKLARHEGPTNQLSFNGQKGFGTFLIEKVFRPGMREPWPAFVKRATGEALTARHFGGELK